jgi:hypothetical protein
MTRVNQSEARVLTPAERADEAARMARARVIGGVRRKRCPQCRAGAYGLCSVKPPGDCLARWLAAYAAGRITRADLIGAISGLVVISATQLVQERAV